MSQDLEDLMRAYLDGGLDENGRHALSEALRRDGRARSDMASMEALASLLEELGRSAPEPSSSLTSRVMNSIMEKPLPRLPWWKHMGQLLTQSPVRLATASGALLAVGLLVGLGISTMTASKEAETSLDVQHRQDLAAKGVQGAGIASSTSSTAADERVRVHFVLRAPEAKSVSLVGDFNGWDPGAHQLERVGDVWRAVVPLPRGRYEYQFVVDGELWLVDPAAHGTVDDGFGGRNGVLEV